MPVWFGKIIFKENEMSKKEVAKKETNLPATMSMDAFGDGGVTSSDIVIPKILAMQGLSNLVTEGKAAFGDFAESLSGTVIGNIDSPIEIIPFHLHKVWIRSKWNGKKFEFVSMEDVTAANENYPWEEVVGGEKFKNEKCFNFYCLRPDDMTLPYIVGFKSTSLKAGKQLATQMYVKNKADGKVPPAKVISLGGTRKKNDDGTFVVLDISAKRDSTTEEIMECLNWFKTIKSGATKADNSDVAPTSTAANPEF